MQLLETYHHRLDERTRIKLSNDQVIVWTTTGKLVHMDYSTIAMDDLIRWREWIRNEINQDLH